MDNITIEILTEKLKKEIMGTTFGKPIALGGYDYCFPYSLKNGDTVEKHGNFLFSLDPSFPLLTYSYDRYEKVNDTSPFYNSLKKLFFATVTDVRKEQGERVITISLRANPNDLSEVNTGYDFILELFPNHPNAYIVAYPYGKIVSLYHEKTNLEKGIFIVRNAPYEYPKERPLLPLHADQLEDLKPYTNNGLYKLIEIDVTQGKHTLDELLQILHDSHDLYRYGRDILPYDFGLPEARKVNPEEIYSSLVSDQKKKAKLAKEKELISLIEHQIKVNDKKIKNLSHDLAAAKKHMVYLNYGQEIYLYQSEIKPKDTLLERDGYSIRLNPDLTAVENANRYFKQYHKAKSAQTILADLIEKAKDEKEYLGKKIIEAKDGTPRDILELKAELLEEGYIRKKQGKKPRTGKISKRKSYEPHYLKGEDYLIGFGMNGLQNETLTFTIAKKDDLFLHVKDHPGSHIVILKGADDEKVRLLAGELALYLSHLEDGEIMYAKRKYVKKNPNKIGLVIFSRYETFFLRNIRASSLACFKKALKQN